MLLMLSQKARHEVKLGYKDLQWVPGIVEAQLSLDSCMHGTSHNH
jgi:hypothetical protein